MDDPEAVYAKNDAFVYREIAGEIILVPVYGRVADAESIFTLNEVGATIWHLVDGKRTLSEVRDLVLREYDAPPEQVETDLAEFVETMSSIEALHRV
jgi:hypothetical protein